jgi:hypothetical protein
MRSTSRRITGRSSLRAKMGRKSSLWTNWRSTRRKSRRYRVLMKKFKIPDEKAPGDKDKLPAFLVKRVKNLEVRRV